MVKHCPIKTIIIGYGNPGRRDDGLGQAAASAIQKLNIENVQVELAYQLAVEYAPLIVEFDRLIFIDASIDGKEPYDFFPLAARGDLSFTSHSLRPEALLALTEEMFSKPPEAFMLSIRGYEFDVFREELSEKATNNLLQAQDFLLTQLK